MAWNWLECEICTWTEATCLSSLHLNWSWPTCPSLCLGWSWPVNFLPTWNLNPRAKAVPGLKLTLEARLAALSVSPSATGVILNMSATTDCESTGRLRSYIAPAFFQLVLDGLKNNTIVYIRSQLKFSYSYSCCCCYSKALQQNSFVAVVYPASPCWLLLKLLLLLVSCYDSDV